MKKLITLLSLAFLLGNTATSAQSVHLQETTVKFDKNMVDAVVAEYRRPESVMEDALKLQLEKEGLGKSGKKKGYILYSNTIWKHLGMYSLDVYFKVDGNKSRSSITVLVSKGYNNFVGPASAPEIISKVKKFLVSLEGTATDVQFALDVEAQKELVSNAEKQYNRALNDSTDLTKEKQKLENEIVQQSSEVQAKRLLLEQHRQKLDGMKQ
jgi:hypothetical protein